MKTYIIDNHPLFIDALEGLIGTFFEENTIHRYTHSLDAIADLDSKSKPDLIFMNIAMPKLDGLGFLKVLDKRKILTPIIMISDNANSELMKEVVEFDISGFIPKAHGREQILDALNRIFNGETYIPETVELRISRIKDHDNFSPQVDSSINALGVTRRQREVLKLAAKGHPNKEIALLLNISEHTVKSHMSAMFHLLHTKSRAECIQRAYQTGLISPPVSQ